MPTMERKMTDTPALLIYTTYRVQSDDREAFRALALRMASAATMRDGCAFLDVAEDLAAGGTFRLIEGWRDQAALEAHASSTEFRSVLDEAATLGITERRVDVYSIAGKSTPAMPT